PARLPRRRRTWACPCRRTDRCAWAPSRARAPARASARAQASVHPHTGWQTGRMPQATSFDPDRIGAGLPAAALIEDIRQLAATGPGLRAVVEAPPGTGKTTVIPPALQQALTSAATSHPAAEAAARPARVLVSQPRRVAARAAAARLASLSGLR